MCVVAGAAVIVLGFFLGREEFELRKALQAATKEVGESAKSASRRASPQHGTGGIADTTEQQALILDVSEAAKGLAELAKNLQGLSAPIQAFLISIIFFLIAAGLAVAQLYR